MRLLLSALSTDQRLIVTSIAMKRNANSSEPSKRLNYHDVYTCPVCRHGEIAALSLMEAFACNFCRHIFTANLEQQVLKMADSQLAIAWRWNGRTWQGVGSDKTELNWGYRIAGIAFVLLPTTLVGLGAYFFPPLPESDLSWFPWAWTGLTFLAHLACIGWLVLEYYQFPIALYLRLLVQRLFARSQ